MKVRTWVEMSQEVDVEVSIADVMSAIEELGPADRPQMLIDCVNRVYALLKNTPDSLIAQLNDEQRRIIREGFHAQVERFTTTPSASGGESEDRVSSDHVANLVEFVRRAPRTEHDHDEPAPIWPNTGGAE